MTTTTMNKDSDQYKDFCKLDDLGFTLVSVVSSKKGSICERYSFRLIEHGYLSINAFYDPDTLESICYVAYIESSRSRSDSIPKRITEAVTLDALLDNIICIANN